MRRPDLKSVLNGDQPAGSSAECAARRLCQSGVERGPEVRRNVRPVNVLLIEEEDALARLLRRALEFGGCRVTRFASDEEAETAVAAGAAEFEVIVFRGAGPGRLERLRAMSPSSRLLEVWQRGEDGKGPFRPDAGSDGVIEMPFEVQDLGALAMKLGRGPPGRPGQAHPVPEPSRRQRTRG
jgi:CheY-like chemotaxis protein